MSSAFIVFSIISSLITSYIGNNLIFRSLPEIIRHDACFFNKETMELKDYFCHDKQRFYNNFKDPHNLAKLEGNIEDVNINGNISNLNHKHFVESKLYYL
jgi:hypothetical protein